eukprot:scaffold10153_cov111-Isochrysis_galbana.AAC.3
MLHFKPLPPQTHNFRHVPTASKHTHTAPGRVDAPLLPPPHSPSRVRREPALRPLHPRRARRRPLPKLHPVQVVPAAATLPQAPVALVAPAAAHHCHLRRAQAGGGAAGCGQGGGCWDACGAGALRG